MSLVKQFIRALLDTLLPPICHVCNSFIPNAGSLHICPDCRELLTPVKAPLCLICGTPFNGAGGSHQCGSCLIHPPHFDMARAHFLYEGAIRNLIHSLKYNRRTHIRHPLALLTVEGLSGFLAESEPQVIVPVPLHRSRLRQRGFNQAILLGAQMARHLSLPLLTDALVRTRPTTPQIELTAVERRLNVKGAFAVKRAGGIKGKRVLLLDDVMTTGSTMDECAKELKKAGATMVFAATIARAPQDGDKR